MTKLSLVFLAAIATGVVRCEEKYRASCGDMLAELHRKPEHLEFIECKPHPDGQTKPLVAEYRVKGVYAPAVERYLVKNFLSGQNQKCCVSGPEMPEISFKWKDGRTYALSFSADETGVHTRSERAKIVHYVTFSREMEEP